MARNIPGNTEPTKAQSAVENELEALLSEMGCPVTVAMVKQAIFEAKKTSFNSFVSDFLAVLGSEPIAGP